MRMDGLKAVGAVVVLGAVMGCQSVIGSPQNGAPLDNAGFMSAWATYRHCESATDVAAMREDALRLAQVATDARPTKPTVPNALKPYVSDPPHRLAVEPASMAAACGLQTAQAAMSSGRMGVADEMYRLVLAYPEGKYPYYVRQARLGLDHLMLQLQTQLAQVPEAVAPSARVAPLAD